MISCKSDGDIAYIKTFAWCKYIINQKLPFKGADGFAECCWPDFSFIPQFSVHSLSHQPIPQSMPHFIPQEKNSIQTLFHKLFHVFCSTIYTTKGS